MNQPAQTQADRACRVMPRGLTPLMSQQSKVDLSLTRPTWMNERSECSSGDVGRLVLLLVWHLIRKPLKGDVKIIVHH